MALVRPPVTVARTHHVVVPRNNFGRAALAMLLALVTASACAPAPSNRASGRPDSSPAAPPEPGRTLVAAVALEPPDLAVRGLRERGVALFLSKRLFNANLALLDERATPHAYLAEALPVLNSDSWRVFPDGRMETTWKLKPGLTWHDGTSLSAEDFAFSWRVYSSPQLGVSASAPINTMESVSAPDDRTIVMRWLQPYPDAGSLAAVNREFPPLPRHILESAVLEQSPDAFGNHAFWSREYVGLGPFRLERWEPGAFVEAVPFDRHVLGRPRIDRVKLVFIRDGNTALANLLSGQVQLAADGTLGLKQATILKREWAARNGGSVLSHPNQWRVTAFQLRPELATHRAILDPRVRKALNHALDKEALQAALYEGEELPSDFVVGPLSQWWPAAENSIVRYVHDPRRSEQLMAERGFGKGSDGFYTSPSEGRFTTELKSNTTAESETELSAMANEWRKTGFDLEQALLPAPLAVDAQARASFTGMFTFNTNAAEVTLQSYTSGGIPSAENRWIGGNRGGWANPAYDRLADAFSTSLEPGERGRHVAGMARIFTEDLPAISLFFRTQAWASHADVRGLKLSAPEAPMPWNIHEWEYR